MNLTAFQIPGYSPEGGEQVSADVVRESSDTTPKNYLIPPVVWMVIFLVVGYIGLSYLVEGE